MNLNNIVIVGGGSAGWMTAATFVRFFPEKKITVIESWDQPTIGVGESTLGQFRRWTHTVGLDDKDFMRYCDASYKLSIKFTDFYDKDAGSFHYPFGQPVVSTPQYIQDWAYAKQEYDLPPHDFVDSHYPASALMNHNRYDPNFYNFDPDTSQAYHFDATKFGLYLRDQVCIPEGVEVITGTVHDIHVKDGEIDHLYLAHGEEIRADLFVDCTGFKSLLMNAVGGEFLDYSDLLPNNRAWAARLPYEDKEKELETYTHCTAIENGWCWNIPLWSRLGTGYVYSDKYVTPQEALKEFQNYLMSDKMVVPRKSMDGIEFKDIKMRVGRYDNTFIGNVVAVGLSAGFIEPLESNGLLSVHENLFYLSDIMTRGKLSEFDKQLYNQRFKKFFDDFAAFVAGHYALSHRDDTKYWQDITNRHYDMNGDLDSPYITKQQAFDQLHHEFMNVWSFDGSDGGMPFIALGMGMNLINPWRKKWLEISTGQDKDFHIKITKQQYDDRKKEWNAEARKRPTLYKWLKDNRYED